MKTTVITSVSSNFVLFDLDSGLFIVEIHNCYEKKKKLRVFPLHPTVTTVTGLVLPLEKVNNIQ